MDDPPSPSSLGGPEMENQLIACVQESLALYLYENARFMAERLVAEFPREVSCLRRAPDQPEIAGRAGVGVQHELLDRAIPSE